MARTSSERVSGTLMDMSAALVQVVKCKVMVYSLVEVGGATGLLNAGLGSLSKLPDVAVHRVLEIVD